ncbi:uncharacterized protein METZ01_LOCUS399758 [marine metagenome]|uniref:Uncharacterized protein n=1 Tax=marine metagenome TaxID=408172 RepID=A0A382VKB7_9ZZZZ
MGPTIELAGYKIGYSPPEKVGDWAGMDNKTE